MCTFSNAAHSRSCEMCGADQPDGMSKSAAAPSPNNNTAPPPAYAPPPYSANATSSAPVWIEAKAPDGRSYWYNADTNESTWDNPNAPVPAPDMSKRDQGAPSDSVGPSDRYEWEVVHPSGVALRSHADYNARVISVQGPAVPQPSSHVPLSILLLFLRQPPRSDLGLLWLHSMEAQFRWSRVRVLLMPVSTRLRVRVLLIPVRWSRVRVLLMPVNTRLIA